MFDSEENVEIIWERAQVYRNKRPEVIQKDIQRLMPIMGNNDEVKDYIEERETEISADKRRLRRNGYEVDEKLFRK